jgi:uncharacterized membrane protein
MTATTLAAPLPPLIRPQYIAYVAIAFAVMVWAIVSQNLWFLNFVHVFCGLLWTGIDLFMGFVLGPILRTLDFPARRAIALRLTPRTMYLMPTLAIITGTTGWFLADMRGYTSLDWPHYGWVAAALALVIAMTVQGLGFLLPTNVRVCLELREDNPDVAKIGGLMKRYFLMTAAQGTMQIAIVVIMAKFVTGI